MRYLVCLIMIFSFSLAEQLTLKISNFSEYIDIELLKDFVYKNDIKLVYNIHESNEAIFKKIEEKNDYDLVIVSSNYISKLKNMDKLEEIDTSKLNNYQNIDTNFLKTNFNNSKDYTIPYLWGTIGLIYNKNLVKQPITKWSDLWRDEFKNSILISNEPTDVFGITLKSLGYSANSTNIEEIDKAYNKLIELSPNIKDISSTNIGSYFIENNFSAGMVFSGDAKLIMNYSNNFDFIYPKEGALKWADGMVILKNQRNKDLAYKFIDFIIDEKNMTRLANTTGYDISNTLLANDIAINKNLKNSEILVDRDISNISIEEKFQNFKNEYKKRFLNEK